MPSFDLSIIIVNWKSMAFVEECLSSIRANAGDLLYEVIVIDNASYDGCAEMVHSLFPEVVFIESRENLGFAGANNRAFAQSKGRNILFLNPDTEIRGAAIQALLAGLHSIPGAGMVGAHLLNSNGSVQTTCITAIPSILNQALGSNYLRKTFPKWRMWGMRPLFQKVKIPVQVEAISGACMMARREVIEEVGCFSTDYFMYSEDMDLCVKITKAGWTIHYIPSAVIVHHAGGSSSRREESNFSNIVFCESLIRFLELHRGRLYAALYRITTALISACRIGLLAMVSPIAIHPQGYRFLARAASKWFSILTWSLGLNRWVNGQPVRVSR